MNSDELQKMASWRVLELLFHQVNSAWFSFQREEPMFDARPYELPQSDSPILAVGDFLIYPRFPSKKSPKTGQSKP